jgi:hypothetical protein
MRAFLFGVVLLTALAFAADRDLAGGYAGEWKSGTSGTGGAIHFALTPSNDGWTGDAGFTYGGAEVPCKTVSVKLKDGKLEMVFDYLLQDAPLRSTLKGEWKDGQFSGTYESAGADGTQGVDAGTWSAKRKR